MGMSTGARRWRPVLLLAAIAVGLLWGGWKWWEFRRHRKAMAEIEAELEDGRHGTAARKLIALLARQPDSDEALYLLGACEMAQGRTEKADKAWARVPPDSQFAPRAILGRMQLRAERGRFAETEQIIRDALDDSRIDGSSLPLSLGPVWCLQGRLEETLRLIEASWDVLNQAGEGDSEPAINLVRGHIELRRSPIPVEMVRSSLDQAVQLASNDDRIWLGKANLAIRVGSYEEAARWLDACLRRRPEDDPVWRARLNWAVATNRVAEAREALKHLPVEEFTPAEIPRLAAWLAARRGDLAGERRALEQVITVDPADFAALDRLAELAVQEGQPARAAELHSRKTEIDRLKARYEKLYQRNQPTRDSAEMARLAERLGRGFQAKAFLTVATTVHPDRDDLRRDLARLKQRDATLVRAGRTLADLLAAELDSTAGSSSSPAPIPQPSVPG
jgi:enediyne biosynthesis protein E4